MGIVVLEVRRPTRAGTKMTDSVLTHITEPAGGGEVVRREKGLSLPNTVCPGAPCPTLEFSQSHSPAGHLIGKKIIGRYLIPAQSKGWEESKEEFLPPCRALRVSWLPRLPVQTTIHPLFLSIQML